MQEPLARAPLLERLLARADPARPCRDWRREAWRIVKSVTAGTQDVDMPAVAPMAAAADLQVVDGGAVFMASPVHCVAGMTNVRLPVDGRVRLEPQEAAELARHFNQDFASGEARLLAGRSGALYCVFARALDCLTHDPDDLLGQEIGGFLPDGPDGPRLRALMSEIEMWLFQRAVSRARGRDGRLSATGLWLWGGGMPLSNPPVLPFWTAGGDPFWGAWRPRADFPTERAALTQSGVVVLADRPGSESWPLAEAAWLIPALAALRVGRIEGVELSAADRCYHIGARWRLRIWRRPRPWWEYFA